ncbi:MAG: polyprenyl synthetase family protein [Promethearchaeota archaeon]
MESKNFLLDEKRKINEKLLVFFNDLIDEESDPYIKEYYGKIKEFILPNQADGGPAKRIRPQILIYSFFGIANDEDVNEFLDKIRMLSLAIEFLHNAILIEEDLISQDDIRRGLPTFHKTMQQEFEKKNKNKYSDPLRWANAQSIYASDLCLSIGSLIINSSKFNPALKFEALNEYYNCIRSILKGKIMGQYLLTQSLEGSAVEDYLVMAESGISAQFISAASIGAILARARSSQIRSLKEAMKHLGIAYQIKNEIRDTFVGKRRDIAIRKRTILLISACQNASLEDKKKLKKLLDSNKDLSPEEVEVIKSIIKSSGALDFVKMYAQSAVNQAISELGNIYPGLREESDNFFNQLFAFVLASIGSI